MTSLIVLYTIIVFLGTCYVLHLVMLVHHITLLFALPYHFCYWAMHGTIYPSTCTVYTRGQYIPHGSVEFYYPANRAQPKQHPYKLCICCN